MFARGLPQKLAEQCIRIENPETFAKWTRAAQRQLKNELRLRSIQGSDYSNTISITVEKSQPKSTKRWGWKRTGNTGRTWRRLPNSTIPDHLIPPDYNVDDMDGVATVRKATKETKRKQA